MSFHKFILLTRLSLSREKIRMSLYWLSWDFSTGKAIWSNRGAQPQQRFSLRNSLHEAWVLMVSDGSDGSGCTRSLTELSFCSDLSPIHWRILQERALHEPLLGGAHLRCWNQPKETLPICPKSCILMHFDTLECVLQHIVLNASTWIPYACCARMSPCAFWWTRWSRWKVLSKGPGIVHMSRPSLLSTRLQQVEFGMSFWPEPNHLTIFDIFWCQDTKLKGILTWNENRINRIIFQIVLTGRDASLPTHVAQAMKPRDTNETLQISPVDVGYVGSLDQLQSGYIMIYLCRIWINFGAQSIPSCGFQHVSCCDDTGIIAENIGQMAPEIGRAIFQSNSCANWSRWTWKRTPWPPNSSGTFGFYPLPQAGEPQYTVYLGILRQQLR